MSRFYYRDTRHITLARVLHARLYVSGEGRIFAVSGDISHEKLRRALERHDNFPTVANAPTPQDLGIASCDGELSQHLLHCISRALNRWRKELSMEMRQKPAKRRSAATLAAEVDEIGRLTSRLTDVRDWRAKLIAKSPPQGAPYFLDAASETLLEAALMQERRECPLTPLLAWQARVVYWLSGNCATRRFLSAATQLISACSDASCRDHIRSFQQAVLVWKKRSEHERTDNLRKEMAEHITRLPVDAARQGRFSARLRGRTFQQRCDHLLRRCGELLVASQRQQWRTVPAALAALAAADHSAIVLPRRCFLKAFEEGGFSQLVRTIARLADEIGLPGYGALLVAVEQLPESPDEVDFDPLRKLLAKGTSLADCTWVRDHDLLHSLADSCLTVPAVRHLDDEFTRHGCPLAGYELRAIVSRIQRKDDLEPVRAWLMWLGSVSPRTITPRMQTVLHAAFWEKYLPSTVPRGWFEQLRPCLTPVSRTKAPGDYGTLLDRIAAYQRLAGKQQMLPKSLRKLLEMCDRRERERQVLRTRRASAALTSTAWARLARLENDGRALPDADKVRRAAEEVFLILGIESLSMVSRNLALSACRAHLGHLVGLIAPERYWDFARWIEAMSDADRDRLREVIVAHQRHGSGYKRHLADNREWIGRALAGGINLGEWLLPEPQIVAIGGRTVEICVASDLHHIFLMGNYFHTCLSLGDCNELSVLANAYDANKQVVFTFMDDDAGRTRVVGRKLIAVSHDFKLVGYRCYVSARIAKVHREDVVNAMASYCGLLAARCGLELTDQGSPQDIADHFWYDDGECTWPAAARATWLENSRSPQAAVLAAC